MLTNKDKCIQVSVSGKVHHPTMKLPGYRIGSDGVARIVPATGGITYNAKIGDRCMDIKGDHIEPGVSLKNPDTKEDAALNILACVGNQAKVITGDAKGALGFVTGKHGGIDHVMIHFEDDILEKLSTDDKIQIKSFGQGLELLDYPTISVMNIDPSLLDRIPIEEKQNKLYVPVKTIVPAQLMGSGLGMSDMHSGDYDIMTRDLDTLKQYHLENLCYGDFVFIQDHANVYGPDYIQGAGTFGIVIHSDSYVSGHGPGVTVLLTSKQNEIIPVLDENANLVNYI
jgi:hypothetical protein